MLYFGKTDTASVYALTNTVMTNFQSLHYIGKSDEIELIERWNVKGK